MNWLLEVFSLVLEKKTESKMANLIVKAYKTQKEFRQKVGQVKSAYELYMNPNNWITLLGSKNKQYRQQILKELNEISKSSRSGQNKYETKEYTRREQDGTKTISKTNTDKQAFNKKVDQMKEELDGQSSWVNLSSSWIKRGKYDIQFKNKMIGSLSLELKNGRIYTYPLVSYDVWVLMKEAKGKNGTRQNPIGAGSTFWKYFLDSWLPSRIRRKVKADLRKSKISKDEIPVIIDYVQKKGLSIPRSKEFKNYKGSLGYEWYSKQGGKGFKSGRIKTYKKLYKANTSYTTYKNVKTYKTVKYTKTRINKEWAKTPGLYDDLKDIKRSVNKARSPLKRAKGTIKRTIRKKR